MAPFARTLTVEAIFTPTLADAFLRAGLQLNGSEPEPGRMVRFPTSERQGDKAGWCRVFPDGDGAVFGDWRAGESFTWQRRDESAPPPTAEEQRAARTQAEAAQREAEQERQRQRLNAAETAKRIWGDSQRMDAHPYLERKGIRSHGTRLDRDGRMVVPVLDDERRFQSLQFIDDKGDKRFLPGGAMKGGRLLLGRIADGSPLLLAEGFATAASVREATGFPAVVAFSGSNLKHVAVDLAGRYPHCPLIVAGDVDEGGQGRRYAEAAASACRGSIAVYPAFADGRTAGDWNDLAQADGVEAVKRQIQAALVPPMRFSLLGSDDLAALPPLRWRVRGLLPEVGLASIFGASKSGKSFLVLDMAQAVAEGRDWFGYRTTPCPVTYCALEGEAGIAGRMAAYRAKHGRDSANVRYMAQRFSLLDAKDRADLALAIRAAGGTGGLVILDTLNRAAPNTDENDSKDMNGIIAAATALQAELGGLVVLIHHTGKDSAKGLRGHSSLGAALDAAIEVARDGERREWKLDKAKDGADGISHAFVLDVVEIGTDDDGEPVTSCVVRPDAGQAPRRMGPPKSGNQRIAWDALGAPLRESVTYGMAGAPPGRPCITMDAAIDHIRGKLPVDPKRRTERARQTVAGLVSRGNLRHEDGWLWEA
jgi:putative DNA primase/helicase